MAYSRKPGRCNCTDPGTCHDPDSHGRDAYRCPGCGGLTPKKKELCLDCLLGTEGPPDPIDTREEQRWEV